MVPTPKPFAYTTGIGYYADYTVRIEGTIWLEDVVEKLAVKHHVAPDEVEEVLDNSPTFYFVETGDRESEDVYMALG